MVTMAAHQICESMGPRVPVWEHFIPTQSLLVYFNFKTSLNFRLTPYYNYAVLEIRQG